MAKIVFSEPAEYDLLGIEYYIYRNLCNPQASKRITDGILNTIEKLAINPESHPLVADELLRRMKLRMTYFDNYNIFYYYDMQEDAIYIVRILYNKMDWNNLLRN